VKIKEERIAKKETEHVGGRIIAEFFLNLGLMKTGKGTKREKKK